MGQKPSLIIFVGGLGGSPVVEMVAACHRAIAQDTIHRAQETGAFGRILLSVDSEDLAAQAPGGVEVVRQTGPFHFGKRLRQLIRDYAIEKPFYIGGGSAPLLSAAELAQIAEQLSNSQEVVIANNLYSSDLVAFSPGEAIEGIEPPALDNPLAQLLRKEVGLKAISLPRNAATQFDVDTPADLLILKLHPGTGRQTRAYLESLSLDPERLREAMRFFTEPQAEVLVAGRVGSYLWAHLEDETACRVRLLCEERGMRADGREDRGEARSILGFHLQEVGPRRFFETLASLGDAAFIDSRVIFAHLGLRPSVEDRFLSDLCQPEAIADPTVRHFTQAALEAPLPVVLGGHSLVAGGLYALVDAAWLEHDQRIDKKPQLG